MRFAELLVVLDRLYGLVVETPSEAFILSQQDLQHSCGLAFQSIVCCLQVEQVFSFDLII
jgi:hypothetical protein